MIFTIIKTYKDVKRGASDPTGFGQDLLLSSIKGPLLLFTISGGLALLVFLVLGFTEFWFGPSLFFKILFFFFGLPYLFLQIIFWSIYKKTKRLVERLRRRVDDEVDAIRVEPK